MDTLFTPSIMVYHGYQRTIIVTVATKIYLRWGNIIETGQWGTYVSRKKSIDHKKIAAPYIHGLQMGNLFCTLLFPVKLIYGGLDGG